MVDLLIIGVVLLMLGLAGRYIVRAKRKGGGCIGCPSAGSCSKKQNGCTGREN